MNIQDTNRAIDPADAAAEAEQAHRERSVAAALNQNATADSNSDDYGICLDCEIEIPEDRLEAVQAIRCIDCQSCYETMRARYAK